MDGQVAEHDVSRVCKFYVICIKSKDLQAAYGAKWGNRVKFVHQRCLGFTSKKIQQVIQKVVDDKVQRVDPTAGASTSKRSCNARAARTCCISPSSTPVTILNLVCIMCIMCIMCSCVCFHFILPTSC